jgi:tetratricopeptide (TPR) repeat protein
VLDPASASAHQWYGDYLYVVGRVGDAIPERRRAAELDPLSAVLNNDLGFALRHAGRYEEALEAEERAAELDPTFVWALQNMAGALDGLGKTDSAIAILEKRDLRELADGDGVAILISAYLRTGRRDDAQRVLDSVRAFHRSVPEGLDLVLGTAQGAMGNVDSAFYWVNRSVERREGYLFASSVSCTPSLAGLRTDPRFDELLKRLGASRCQTGVSR